MSQVSLGRPEFVPGTPPGHPTAKFLYVIFLYRFFLSIFMCMEVLLQKEPTNPRSPQYPCSHCGRISYGHWAVSDFWVHTKGVMQQHASKKGASDSGVWRRGEIGKGWDCNTWPRRPHSKHVWNIPSHNRLQTNYCTRHSRHNAMVLRPWRAILQRCNRRLINSVRTRCNVKTSLKKSGGATAEVKNPPRASQKIARKVDFSEPRLLRCT